MTSLGIGLLILAAGLDVTDAGVVTEEIDYQVDGATMKGYLAYNGATSGRRPGVIVVHEWWGLNDYVRRRARMLAKLGYTAFALDMYGAGKQAQHPDDARKFSSEVRKNLPMEKARFTAALDVLRHNNTVDPRRIAAIGYCFGGGVVLEMARRGIDLAGVASFHGMLATADPARPDEVKAKILVMTGADDPFVPADQVTEFKAEMDAEQVDYKVIAYPGAKHGFTNPAADKYGQKFDLPLAYNKAADQASWQALQEFLQQIFRTQ
ncbi:MAG: dienelactone hydrolase family protein [Gammaproteobacteria bacterium]|jgi:dienelactone hydrolase